MVKLTLEDRIAALEAELAMLTGDRAEQRQAEEQFAREWEATQTHTLIKCLIAHLVEVVPSFDLEALRSEVRVVLVDLMLPKEGCSGAESELRKAWAMRNEMLIAECFPDPVSDCGP